MTAIDIREVRWVGVWDADPMGRVFEWRGEFFRAVKSGMGGAVRGLLASDAIQALMAKGALIATEIAPLTLDGWELVLAHEQVPFQTNANDWSRTMLRDAAEAWVRMNLELLPLSMGLVDAHGGNFGQRRNARLTWYDFGSIVTLSKSVMGVDEYRLRLGNPVTVLGARPQLGRLVSTALTQDGIGDSEVAAICGRPSWSPGRFLRGRAIAKETDIQKRRKLILESLLAEIPAKLSPPGTFWENYQSNNPIPAVDAGMGPRQQTVRKIIEELRPRAMADMASNEGYFSFLAAGMGIKVFALDFDEGAVESLYRHALSMPESASVTVACSNVMTPRRRGPQAELAIALALTHHLAVAQRFRWEYIVKMLSSYTTDALLVEYMPNGLAGREKPKEPLPEWYTLEAFMNALSAGFSEVRIVDYTPAVDAIPRTMILCKGRRN